MKFCEGDSVWIETEFGHTTGTVIEVWPYDADSTPHYFVKTRRGTQFLAQRQLKPFMGVRP